jgi:pimeloyl-ACP methyl ester carboxylesterase
VFGHEKLMVDASYDLCAFSSLARLVAEFLEQLNLRDVTLVGNDWGGPQLLVLDGRDRRIGRLVMVFCEAFGNFPPGLPGRAVWLAAKVPGGINAMVQPLRLRPLRRMPAAFGWMSKRPVPADVMDAWLQPLLTQPLIRRHVAKYLHATGTGLMLKAAARLHNFDRPALVVWATEDRVMPPEHGRRLAELLPRVRVAGTVIGQGDRLPLDVGEFIQAAADGLTLEPSLDNFGYLVERWHVTAPGHSLFAIRSGLFGTHPEAARCILSNGATASCVRAPLVTLSKNAPAFCRYASRSSSSWCFSSHVVVCRRNRVGDEVVEVGAPHLKERLLVLWSSDCAQGLRQFHGVCVQRSTCCFKGFHYQRPACRR